MQTLQPGVELRAYNEIAAGFMRVTVDPAQLKVEYFAVPIAGASAGALFDSVTLDYKASTITDQMAPGTTGAAP